MPGTIKVLPRDVVALIAAGEVVQRPAACLKELVENALDAGAASVSVSIENGGLDSIRVTDNGGGIRPEDMRLAFAPHATSKLAKAEDLRSIASLGFRGEALASIAQVSKVTLTSRTRDSDEGMKAVNEGGEMVQVAPAACAQGTQVLVRDLFYSAPVRRDFLDNPRREAARCAEVMASFILANPGVAFRYAQDGKSVYQSPGDGRLAGAVLAVYGLNVLDALFPVDGGEQGALVQGLVGIGEEARPDRSHQHFFVNGRAVRSPVLSAALEEACRTRVMIGKHPLCALHLRLPYDAVDVNVHPNKWEVRFRNERAVADAVMNAVRAAVSALPTDNAPPLFPREERTAPAPIVRLEPNPDAAPLTASFNARDAALDAPSVPYVLSQPGPEAVQEHAPFVPAPGEVLRVIGKAFGTYIVAEQGERLLLIDQHALHERLLYDRMMAHGGDVTAQPLLVPQIVELDYPGYQAFLAFQKDLARAGFEAEDFGSRSVRLLSVPLELGEPAAVTALRDALDELRTGGAGRGESRAQRIASAACKHAVKGGERLPEGALQSLVDQMIQSGTIPSCPHGRPIVLEVSRRELERRFRRIQG